MVIPSTTVSRIPKGWTIPTLTPSASTWTPRLPNFSITAIPSITATPSTTATPTVPVDHVSGAFKFFPGGQGGGEAKLCSYYALSRQHRKLKQIPRCAFRKAARYLKNQRPDDVDTRSGKLRTLIVILNASADQAERMDHDDNERILRKRAHRRLKRLVRLLRKKGLPKPDLQRLGFPEDDNLGMALGDFLGDLGEAAQEVSPMTKALGGLLGLAFGVWYLTKK